MAVKITERETKGWRQLQRLAHAGRPHVRIGFLEDGKGAEDHEGITTAELGAIHEFGAGNVPERSFLRATLDIYRTWIVDETKTLLGAVLAERFSAVDALEILGSKVTTKVKQEITMIGIAPELHPDTIARKGSTRPLVDTGQLLNSITWSVVSAVGK